MINAEIAMKKDNKVVLTMSGSESEIVAESMVLLKSIYEGLKDAGAKNVKDSMRIAIVYALISGNLFDEEPCGELLDTLLDFAGINKKEFNKQAESEATILEDEDSLRKAFEKAAAYGN